MTKSRGSEKEDMSGPGQESTTLEAMQDRWADGRMGGWVDGWMGGTSAC